MINWQLGIWSGTTYVPACVKSYVFLLKVSRAVQRNRRKRNLLKKKKEKYWILSSVESPQLHPLIPTPPSLKFKCKE